MDILAKRQSEIGYIIDKLWINFNKDSKDRKTEDYLKRKLEILEENWKEFEFNDDKLRNECADPTKEDYFLKDFYQQVEELYLKMKSVINDKLAQFDKRVEFKDNQASEHLDNTHLVIALKNTMLTLESILATAAGIEDTSRVVIEHMASRLDKYIKFIELKVEAILEKGNIEYPHGEVQELQARAEQMLFSLKQKLDDEAIVTNSPIPPPRLRSNGNVASPMMKLTNISVPKFNGDHTKWTQFHDLFTQLVHNQDISNAVKMFYLKDNISGEAERVIRHLNVSEANYDVAWAILKDKYDDQRELLNRWLEKLVNQRPISAASSEGLKQLHDNVRESTLAIDSLNIDPRKLWEAMILFIISNKLDNTSKTLYEQSLTQPQSIQPLGDFIKFLHTRYRSLNVQGVYNIKATKHAMVTASSPAKLECPICKANHPVYQCEKFLKLNAQERNEAAFKAKLCLNCLKKGHFSNKCNSRCCARCGKRHNTLLHPFSEVKTNHNAAVNISTNLNIGARSRNQYIFLATALLDIQDISGNWVQCRALIDSGSQVNIATDRLRKKLKLDSYNINLGLAGLGETRIKVDNQLQLKIRSRTSDFSTEIDAVVMKSITSTQPHHYVNIDTWNIPKNIHLADPRFNEPQHVDLLLGAELYGAIMLSKQLRLSNELPILHQSTFGWLIIGGASSNTSQDTNNGKFCGIGTINLDEQLKKFWELEEYLPQQRLTKEEVKCETFFDATTIRENGRFTVNIPLHGSPTVLGDSKAMAYKRFMSIERKLSSNLELKKQYVEFMHEYEKLGHMREVSSSEIKGPHYYIPHHCVLKPSSSTTKLRVVFDASAKTSSNISLNEIMLNGPRIQDEIFAITLRFRTKKYVFTADIKQMYRQINVSTEDRNLQLILWRDEPSHSIKTYQLCTVTYGTKSAPYLATKCLQRLAEEEEENYPRASKAARDFYVDDILTGSDDIEEAIETQHQVQQMLEAGGFQLRKWCANHPRLLENIPQEHLEMQLDFNNKNDDYTKPLGLIWHPVVDQFQTTVNIKLHEVITKRTILSDTAQLFDPLGLVNPVIVHAKIFMQQLWKMKLDWDEIVPAELQAKWISYRNGLTALQDLRIPRYMFADNWSGRIMLHAFADASEKAYGTAIYLRTVNKSGEVVVRLFCARSKVAPLKQTKLPLLELCAAKMTAELVKVVREHLTVSLDDVYFWSDSEIVLNWIQRDAATLVTFVANRVSDIQTLSDVRKWRYVPSQDNPADLVSRGCTAEQLSKETMWFSGPIFLQGSQRDWPKQPQETKILQEYERTLKLILTTTQTELPLIEQINHGNSFRKLQRILAFVIRGVRMFKLRIRHSVVKAYSETIPTLEELEDAAKIIFQQVQQASFATEFECLKQNKILPKGNKLTSLAPFIDENGLIRVGGRLEESSLMYDEQHPILLPQNHWVSRLYFALLHINNLHAGPQAMTAISRQRVWIIQGRQLARSIVNSCIRCVRTRPKCATQVMGQLPATRVTMARPFINCGVDFCGPVWTHFKVRGRKPQKTYIAVFCCFSTKAIHIEVVSDLSTDGFLGALKRFMSRRGSCQNIYSDNGRNFVGARNQIHELQDVIFGRKAKEEILTHCNHRRVQFHFIPPRAPHMGGLWEAAVKSLKHLLQRTVASTALTYEELCTVTAEIEAVLNSRPITPMSTNPNDLNALTPGHFLIGEPMTATVDPHACDNKMSLLTRWQLVSFCRSEFWKRWSVEYITNLQQRAKWVKEFPNMVIGTLVLIKEDNMPPLQWSMGRIVDVITGRDGNVRVADVRTATGIIRRAIHVLAPLPIEFENESINQSNEFTAVENKSNESNKPTEVEDEPRSQSKKPRKSRQQKIHWSAFLSTIVTVFLLLLPLVSATKLNHVQILPLKTNAGLFYDRVGQVYLSPTHWTIMAYYDLSGFHGLEEGISRLIERMQLTSEAIVQPGPYNELIKHFEKRLAQLSERNKVLMQSKTGRNRRAAINMIGTVFNRLFGVLDTEFAEEMKTTIENINSNEGQLQRLLNNHTSILDATLNLIKQDRKDIINHTLQLQRELKNSLSQLENKVAENVLQDRAIEHFNLLSSITMSYFQEYEQIQDNIADVTFGLNQGHTSIHIISPNQLQAQLDIIKQQIPPSLSLPPSQQMNLHSLYKIMKTQGRIHQGYYLFKIKIPLLINNHFNAYHLISVPIAFNNTQLLIEATTDYLAIDLKANQYYAMSTMEFEKCALFSSSVHICLQERPIENGYARSHQCESELILAKVLPSSCVVTAHYPRNIWKQLSTVGTWLYSVMSPTQITIICNNGEIERATISNAGVISLAKGCTLRTLNISLTSYDDLVTDIKLAEQPQVNLSTIIQPTKTHHKEAHQQINVTSGLLFHHNIKNIEDRINRLNAQQTNLKELQPHDVHQYSVSYTTLILIILVIFYLLYRAIGSRMTCVSKKEAFQLQSTASERREDVGINNS